MPERLLYKLGSLLAQDEEDFDGRLQRVVGELAAFFGMDKCSLMLINPDELTLEVRAATNPALIGAKRRLSDVSIATRALIDDAPFSTDRKTLSFFRPLEASRYDSEQSFSIPLKYQDRKIGVVNFTDGKGGQALTAQKRETAIEVMRRLSVYLYAALTKPLLEQQGRKHAETVQRLKRLDEHKTTLTSFIVHDLKGPISTIMANLDMLGSEPLSAGQAECVNIALQDAHKMQRMVLNILDLTKLEEGRVKLFREETDLAALARQEIESFKAIAALRNIDIVLEGAAPPCHVDETLIGRAVSNLLLNAIEHSPDGAKILVAVSPDSAGSGAVVSVADQGKGIPDAFKERIFDKFFQVEEGARCAKATTGLGLTFCKLVVTAHGGSLWVEDAPEGGARFLFRLPALLIAEHRKEAVL